MQSLHELERRAEVHRLEALKKIEALADLSAEEQELRPEAPSSEDRAAESTVPSTPASHQHG
jgi:hypothetical protein